MYLGTGSFYHSKNVTADLLQNLHDRPSDGPADILLMDILQRVAREDPFDLDFKKLQDDVSFFLMKDMYTYFQKSCNCSFYLSWGLNYAQDFQIRVKTIIQAENRRFEAKIQKSLELHKQNLAPPLEYFKNLSKAVTSFIPYIKQLSTMTKGLPLAFDFALYMGDSLTMQIWDLHTT